MMGRALVGGLTAMVMLSGGALADEPAKARTVFVDGAGGNPGMAELTQAGNGVLIELDLTGLPPAQWVAFHVHEHGSCDPATGHDSAGGHFNPGGHEHGYLAATGPHAGDMPNQFVSAEGALKAQVYLPGVTLAAGDTGITGRALMIHAKADDYKTQPSGDAGKRLACGVIE